LSSSERHAIRVYGNCILKTNFAERLSNHTSILWISKNGKSRGACTVNMCSCTQKKAALRGAAYSIYKGYLFKLFPSKTKGVVFNENSIDLVPFQGNEIYCMMTRPLDFFQTAVRIKYRLPEGCGGVVFCGSPTPVTSPEENGYMLVFNNNKMILKRNTNTINIEPCPNRPETVVIEKKGVVISIAVNGKTLMKHIDETPFYGDYASLTGFGLYAPVPSRYTDISIETAAFL